MRSGTHSPALATSDVNSPEQICVVHAVVTNVPSPHHDGMKPLKPRAKQITPLLNYLLSGDGIQQ